MPDAHDDSFRQHEAMLQDVPRMLAIQHTTECIDRALDDIHRTLARVEMMQASIDTLLARVFGSQKTRQRTRKAAPVV
jgi:hypothetical protein